jgi:hypothetical protein
MRRGYHRAKPLRGGLDAWNLRNRVPAASAATPLAETPLSLS